MSKTSYIGDYTEASAENLDEPPPMALWITKELRQRLTSKQWKLNDIVVEWSKDNLHQGLHVVRFATGENITSAKRYGLKFGSERDLVIFKLFWSGPDFHIDINTPHT
jgi:hypothetical protein